MEVLANEISVTKEELFCTPPLIAAKVSPDGETIAYIGADEEGIPNVFVASREAELEQYAQITFFKSPDIIQFFWSADSDKILLLKDENGTGQLNLYGIDPRTKELINYTEKFSGVNAKVIKVSSEKNCAVIGLNFRNPHFHDLYLLDLDLGEFALIFENDVYAKFLLSDELNIILKIKINEDSSWTIYKEGNEIFMHLKAEDAFQTEFLSYNEKNGTLYVLDNRFSNTNQLVAKTLDYTRKDVLGVQSESDIDEVLFIEGEPKAYASYFLEKKWHAIDPFVKKELTFLENRIGSNFEVISQSRNEDIWVISHNLPDQGGKIWVYERRVQKLTPLTSSASKSNYAKMYAMVAPARDGQQLVCYYTLPKEHDREGFVESPLPLVVIPHGGPFKARDRFQFNPYHQWLASCGYAVLSVNFRLSSGFGKEFVNAGNGEWGGKAHLDVIDAVESCITKGLTERGKVAILGGSYGGYESLAALTFTPEYFACCVAICGPSSLKTVLDNVPQFWEFTSKPLSDRTMFFTKRAFITSMGGDPETQKGIKYLEKCSPLHHLENIKVPLLLVHGQNDHIVNERESRQIYDSMKKNGKEVTYILFPDEGHRFAKFANKMLYLDRAEHFLSQHLGGKYYSIQEELIAHSSGKIIQ